MASNHPRRERERGAALAALPLIIAVAAGLAFVALMLVAMAMWPGGDHMGMMRRGNSGAGQTPVVSAAQQVTIEMKDYTFFPANLTVDAGAEITWVNHDAVPHNAIDGDGAFDTGTVGAGASAAAVLDTPGVYPYVCTFHPGMEGTIIVR